MPAVLVLLRDERLALDLRRRQRPRGRLGDGHRLPGRGRTPARARPGSPSPRTTTRATTCAGAGTTPSCAARATTRWSSPAPARTRAPSCPGDYVDLGRPAASCARLIRSLQPPAAALAPWRARRRCGPDRAPGFGIPFVDYARGDGVAIGPGQERGWTPVLIGDDTPWVRDYRGLWGLDTQRPLRRRARALRPALRARRHASARRGPTRSAGPGCRRSRRRPTTRRAAGASGWPRSRPRCAELDDEIARAARDRAPRCGPRRVSLARPRLAAQGLARERAGRGDREREAALNETIARRTRLAEERRAHLDTLSRPPAEPPQAHLTTVAPPPSRAAGAAHGCSASGR